MDKSKYPDDIKEFMDFVAECDKEDEDRLIEEMLNDDEYREQCERKGKKL